MVDVIRENGNMARWEMRAGDFTTRKYGHIPVAHVCLKSFFSFFFVDLHFC